MDECLCDELVQEIFHRLPPRSSSSIPLVSKRWLSLYRASKASLSLLLSPDDPSLESLSSFLSHYPSLSSLSLSTPAAAATADFSDQVLVLVSSLCPRLLSLRFLSTPVSLSSLASLSRASRNLTSLSISLSRPLSLTWLLDFASLRDLSIVISKTHEEEQQLRQAEVNDDNYDFAPELAIESLCLSGLRNDDRGLGWLWKSCGKRLGKLQLRGCEGIGDGGSFSSFAACLGGVREVELRTCRTIVDGVLAKLVESCETLESLLVYDGGSREGLVQFFGQCRSRRKLDLRLPLDLGNDHLLAVSSNFGATLRSVRLQSCCLVSGKGLKALGFAASSGLEELALINCDVVEREPGLLATLGQSLRKLRQLDLSYNETLVDKEFVSMLASCRGLVELKICGCKGLTGSAVVSMCRSCEGLESVDVANCARIDPESVEFLVKNSPRLKRVRVEESKLSDAARNWAARKFIEIVG